jgi:hypothetical protein
MLPLHLALKKIQMMISLQLVQALGFLDQGGLGKDAKSSDAHGVVIQKIVDFLDDYAGEDIFVLVLEEHLLHLEDM